MLKYRIYNLINNLVKITFLDATKATNNTRINGDGQNLILHATLLLNRKGQHFVG